MIFTAPEFAIFGLAFFALWFSLGRLSSGVRRPLLLAASYAFYGSWNAKFLLLIVGSTALDFWVGRAIAATDDPKRRRRLLQLSLLGNLGSLGFFKYYGFFAASVSGGLAALGLDVGVPTLEVILPVGISFYTFQTLSYTIDVYRRDLPAARNFIDFALYVSFFPQLVAGPIERASHLLPQMRHLSGRADWSGLGLIALGAFKKAAIADNLAGVVDLAYTQPHDAYAPALWIGTWAFAFQIYCDFSGYSDMAVGLARLLGLDLVQNFRAPYASAGPSEFWRRWHISLSTWLRDYLYIPLGGNRGGPWATQRNLALTMLLGGLWHGAAWNFVLWGAWQGLMLAAFRPPFWRRLNDAVAARIGARTVLWLRRIVFFQLVCLGWALFRAGSLAECGVIWGKLLSPAVFTELDLVWNGVLASGEGPFLMGMGALCLGLWWVQNRWPTDPARLVAAVWRGPVALRAAFVLGLLYIAAVLAPETPPPFLYFQF
jgi:D-alanyl-lipoteichoic acid acyltransferase DltB (MBOAT superfamily)